jgi:hypothetical protein
MITLIQHALEGHVERIGAIERKNKPLRAFAVKKLIQQMPAIIESTFSRQRHLVPRSARVGEILARETVKGLINGFRLGKTGGSVVEVDHGLAYEALAAKRIL